MEGLAAAGGRQGARFRDVFGVAEFRVLWVSQLLSVAGDRLALVAVALLVYDRTGSPLLTALAYAAGFVPWVAGGLLLAGLADRFPRRAVMVACDGVRAVLVAGMAVPGVPLLAVVVLLFAATTFAPPFESARAAILPGILAGDRYVLGTAVVQTTYRAAMVAGYGAGGIAVAALGARPALALDAATFAVSGVVLRCGLGHRAAAGRPGRAVAEAVRGAGLVFASARLRTLMLLGWLVAFYAVPEGLAAPYARRVGGGPAATGLILAAAAFGGVLAAPLFTRLVSPQRRLALMGPFAAGACATLLLCLAGPGLGASLLVFAVSGVFGVYQIAANAAFVTAVPDSRRGQAFGLANAGLIVGQGVVFLLAGAAAETFAPAGVIAVCGGAGTLAAVLLALRWRRLAR